MIELKTTVTMGDIADSFTAGAYQAGELARLLAIIHVDALDCSWHSQFRKKSTANTINTLKQLLDIATTIPVDNRFDQTSELGQD